MQYQYLIFLTGVLLVMGSIIIFGSVLFNKWLKYKERAMVFDLKKDNNKALATLRVTAYERLTIMLERITPEALVLRLSHLASSSANLQAQILKAIREEFDHNISLQIYVSPSCWKRIVVAREQVSELMRVAFTKVGPQVSAVELSKVILTLEAEVGNTGIQDALNAIRQEMEIHI